jgi:hypothetical protein
MGFLDNSGDIILDAVLTDTGRFRLAKGDGSFKIVKFALGDGEINYGTYNKNHASGSAYYDLEVLQTPIFEAFTNNTSTMHYKLLSIPRTNLLYLPIMKINGDAAGGLKNAGNDGFMVCVDDATNSTFNSTTVDGIFNGQNQNNNQLVRVDQGLDTTEISWTYDLDQDLKETQYIIEVDNRLGMITSVTSARTVANISFIDDDNIASYYLSTNDSDFVQNTKNIPEDILSWDQAVSAGGSAPTLAVIDGPQGTALRFKIKSSINLISSNFLFEQLGQTGVAASSLSTFNGSANPTGTTYAYIDTMVKVTGATTGYRIDIPVRFIKKTA